MRPIGSIARPWVPLFRSGYAAGVDQRVEFAAPDEGAAATAGAAPSRCQLASTNGLVQRLTLEHIRREHPGGPHVTGTGAVDHRLGEADGAVFFGAIGSRPVRTPIGAHAGDGLHRGVHGDASATSPVAATALPSLRHPVHAAGVDQLYCHSRCKTQAYRARRLAAGDLPRGRLADVAALAGRRAPAAEGPPACPSPPPTSSSPRATGPRWAPLASRG